MKIKAYAKVNIFLKITGHKDGYHTLLSRFAKVSNLYDEIEFIESKCDKFTIEGCEFVDTKSNTIYKAFIALNKYSGNLDLLEFFYNHKVVVTKNIPSQAGLGGGSSDGAYFMLLVNEVCKLNLDVETLAKIGSTIGADFPFFIYNYSSANVSGFGDIVEEFDEPPLQLEIFTPNISCDTTLVYKRFKNEFLDKIKLSSFIGWDSMSSKEILKSINNPIEINDLYKSALIDYPQLKNYQKDGWFFSGSGSSFFRLI
ncbi:4-diphosphocytidyl-2-C-methyl-D-erythritol kinase [hydrothermal vent metagenome]|uniref:4-diphosphocytidyl-2-C-methyl-D-erythritol kinase n=1 Tax=hydrothermal vent metagenome TaxID=652676 RepID=A0A1W1EHZ9_9ZZZZ